MAISKQTSGVALATAAALLFGSLPLSSARADEAKVHCAGGNACKGQSACKSSTNACKGQNACKGKGFSETTKKQCDAAKAANGK